MLRLTELDDSSWADLVEEARTLIPTLQPDWTDHNPSDPGIALLELFAWLTEMVIFRLNELPDENYWTFLKLIQGSEADRSLGLEAAIRAAVLDLRQPYRAVTPLDYERLAMEQWPGSPEAASLGWRRDIARVRCVPECNLEAGPDAEAPGHMSMVVMPRRQVLRFDGVSDYLSCAVDPYLRLTGDLTVAGWICPGNVARGYQPILTRGSEFSVVLQDTGLISVLQGIDPVPMTHPGLMATTGRWTHFAITRSADARTLTFYLDGIALGTSEWQQDPQPDRGPVYLAGTPESLSNFEGLMIDLCVWRRIRTSDEIAADVSNPVGGGHRNLVAGLADRSSPGWTSGSGLRLDDPALFGPTWTWLAHESLLRGLKHLYDQRRMVTTRVHTVNPGYLEVSVEAVLYVRLDADMVTVRTRAEAAVRGLFDLMNGGRDGRGWPFGRNLYLSDLYTALEAVEGIDFVRGGKLTSTLAERALFQTDALPDTPEASIPYGIRLEPHELPVLRSIAFTLMEPRRGEWREVVT